MKTIEQDIQEVNLLLPGGSCHVAWSEEGGGKVHRALDTLYLFSIPQYGGEDRLEGEFRLKDAGELVKLAHAWT